MNLSDITCMSSGGGNMPLVCCFCLLCKICCGSDIAIGGATAVWICEKGKKTGKYFVAGASGSMVDGVDIAVTEYGLKKINECNGLKVVQDPETKEWTYEKEF